MVGGFVGLPFPQERHMQSHVISSPQSILEFHILDPSLLLLNAVCVPEIHQLLDRRDELVILINRVVTRDIHIEPGAFLDDRQTDAASADNCDGFARDLIAKEWQKRMPRRPFLFAHQALALPDRKSTRLNSSHVSISYAVFCLK